MHPYILLYKTLLPKRYRSYLQRAEGNLDKCHEALLLGTFYEEYDLYDFAHKTPAQRREYLTDHVRDRICRQVNSRRGSRIVANKWLTYCRLRQFYRRRVLLLDSPQALDEAVTLGMEKGRLVVKPADQCGGRSVQLLQASSEEEWHNLLQPHRGMLAEECIVQDERLAAWNPSSVNTIRINTFLVRHRVRLFTAFLRTGRAGSFVDNGAQGGLFASINIETGIICTHACDEHGHTHRTHPDSQQPFRDQQIPRWRELITLAKDMALEMKNMVYIGWDFALTPDGWEPVEANRGEFVAQQLTLRRGLRLDFEQACGL